ncbi:MAG: hypothetical protein WD472_11320 [Dehalococcoidia bacterium]
MGPWNFNIAEAPRGSYTVRHRKFGTGAGDTRAFEPAYVYLATRCGIVTRSHYLPEEKRWEMLSRHSTPLAWQPYVAGAVPEHPSHSGEGT